MKVPSFGPLQSIHCPLCGPSPTRLVIELPGFGELFRVVRCRSCGLIYTNPRPTPEWKARFYDPKYNAWMEAHGRDYVYAPTPERIPGYQRLNDLLLKHVKLPAKLLDAGCATGLFVNTANQRGFDAAGCDYTLRAVQIGRERYHADLFHSPIENVDRPDASYDVVTLLHVFEHLPTPIEVLREVLRLLKPGGLMLLETVNYLPHYAIERYLPFLKPIYCRLTRRDELPWVPFEHLFHWTPQTLRAACQRAGFENVVNHYLRGYRSEQLTPKLSPAYFAASLVGESLLRITRGHCNFWPVLLITARKPPDFTHDAPSSTTPAPGS